MEHLESRDLSAWPSWVLAVLTGCALTYFYILIASRFSLNSDFLVLQFSNVNKPDDTLMLLYLGYFLMGSLGSVISAFLTVYIPSFFFRQSPIKFGVIAGIVATLLLVSVLLFNEASSPGFWSKRPGFLLIELFNWMILIGCSGITSLLGYKTREKFLTLYNEARLR